LETPTTTASFFSDGSSVESWTGTIAASRFVSANVTQDAIMANIDNSKSGTLIEKAQMEHS
jgi:hypothetical protein